MTQPRDSFSGYDSFWATTVPTPGDPTPVSPADAYTAFADAVNE